MLPPLKPYSGSRTFNMTRFLVIALCIILSGCDATQLVYNRANWFLGYEALRYFDLDTAQRPGVKQDIDLWLSWHRRTQLLCYANLIDQFESRTSQGLNKSDLIWLENEFMASYDASISHAMIPIAAILTDLNTKQIAHLEKRLTKYQRKLARKYGLNSKQQKKRRAKKTISGLKKWFGRLSRTQISWLEKRSRELPGATQPWLEYRAQRDQALIDLLRSGNDPDTVVRVIKPMWSNTESFLARDSQLLMEELRTQSMSMAVDFYALTTARQKNHFWNRLRNYREDFHQLASLVPNARCE